MNIEYFDLKMLSSCHHPGRMIHFQDIEDLQQSIQMEGLLNPLVAHWSKNGLEVLDGRKRLIALKSLVVRGMLPRSLVRVPVTLDPLPFIADRDIRPLLLSDAELVSRIGENRNAGLSREQISRRMACSLEITDLVLSLRRLNPHIRAALYRSDVSLKQAAALATLPCHEAQWRLLQQLGPFAEHTEILCAVAKGDTVIDLPNGEIMILPSRRPPDSAHTHLASAA